MSFDVKLFIMLIIAKAMTEENIGLKVNFYTKKQTEHTVLWYLKA